MWDDKLQYLKTHVDRESKRQNTCMLCPMVAYSVGGAGWQRYKMFPGGGLTRPRGTGTALSSSTGSNVVDDIDMYQCGIMRWLSCVPSIRLRYVHADNNNGDTATDWYEITAARS